MARTSTETSTGSTTATGKEVLAYCTKCKMDLAHTIVAMKGDKIAKVHCKTCDTSHLFKAPKGITEPPKKKRTKKAEQDAANQALSIEAEWTKLMTVHKDAPIKKYTTKTPFILGDKLAHPTFGDGIVGRLIYPNKVEVIFRNDMKILIHGGHPTV